MVEPACIPAFTYADVLTWPEEERWELIDGVAYDMSPAPMRRHQDVLFSLARIIADALEGSPCYTAVAPFDVRLPRAGEDGTSATTVVQPDIAVICDRTKLDDHGCVGAPTLVVEILSPSTASKDVREKRVAYERAGVPEYWVIYPTERLLHVYLLDEKGRYGAPVIFTTGEEAPVAALPCVTIDLTRVFAEM